MNDFKEIDEQVLAATVCAIILCLCCVFACFSNHEEITFPTTEDDAYGPLTGYDTDIILTAGSSALDPIIE